MYENPWLFEGEIFESDGIDNYVGFVYTMKNVRTGRLYIGKKFFWTTKTKYVKKKKKRVKVESDWKNYYGSNELLKEDILIYGKDNFSREIIKLCKSKSECSYYEAKEQFINDVLLSDNYYNNWIMIRVRKDHLIKR